MLAKFNYLKKRIVYCNAPDFIIMSFHFKPLSRSLIPKSSQTKDESVFINSAKIVAAAAIATIAVRIIFSVVQTVP